LGIPIDLMLISNTLAVPERHAGPDLGSDHLPVLSTVDIYPKIIAEPFDYLRK
jgi:endonuclease/exonuclease/phosphatase (EEP) superfamily protein YafD